MKDKVKNFGHNDFNILYGNIEDNKLKELLWYLIKEPKCFDRIRNYYYVREYDNNYYLMEHSIWRTDSFKTIKELIDAQYIKTVN